MPGFNGKLVDVTSGNIAKIGIDEKATAQGLNIVRVVFKNGRTYDYQPVSKAAYLRAFSATSINDWFTRELKNNKEVKFKEVHEN